MLCSCKKCSASKAAMQPESWHTKWAERLFQALESFSSHKGTIHEKKNCEYTPLPLPQNIVKPNPSALSQEGQHTYAPSPMAHAKQTAIGHFLYLSNSLVNDQKGFSTSSPTSLGHFGHSQKHPYDHVWHIRASQLCFLNLQIIDNGMECIDSNHTPTALSIFSNTNNKTNNQIFNNFVGLHRTYACNIMGLNGQFTSRYFLST